VRYLDLYWRYLATVCQTVRPMLSDRCLSCLSERWCMPTVTKRLDGPIIKMQLGMQVDLDHGNIVLDGDPAPPPQKGHTHPIFGPSVLAKWLDGLKCYTWYGLWR